MRKQRSHTLPLHDIEACSTASSDEDSLAQQQQQQQQKQVRSSAQDRVREISERDRQAIVHEHAVGSALANRAYHLPGYSYCADWCQYVVNNHLVFGICCRHPQHPLSTKLRVLNLLGSALFGLAITNFIWLGYIYYDEDPDSVLFKVTFKGNTTDGESSIVVEDMMNDASAASDAFTTDESSSSIMASNFTNFTTTMADELANLAKPGFELFLPGPKNEETAETLGNTLKITKGMMVLWTLGGALHAFFDSTIWYMSACGCCLPGNRCARFGWMRGMGSAFTIFVVTLVTALASFGVVLRATLMGHAEIDFSQSHSAGLMDDAIDITDSFSDVATDIGAYEFVFGYFVEFMLALFLYYPLFMTLLFTGSLNWMGCGKVRFLGGRPFEMKELEEQQREEDRRARSLSSKRHKGLVSGKHCLTSPNGALSSKPLPRPQRSSYRSVSTGAIKEGKRSSKR